MFNQIRSVLPYAVLSVAVSCSLQAQAPEGAPPKPDSAQVKADVEKAEKTGGEMWSKEAHFFCVAPRANALTDPEIEPTKIFDNVWAIGTTGTTAYAITTSAGVILIDSLGPTQTESILLPGLKKAGIDPKDVKYIVLGHGHADHFGGATYMQEHFGTHVVLSQADWDMLAHPAAAPQGKGAPATPPNKDMVAMEGQPITLGDEKITPYFIPGHTPGSTGFIFPVKDQGKTHMAAMYAGTILLVGRIPDAGLQQYMQSIAHFKEETKKAKVDVELQNHPLMDPIEDKLAKLKDRKKGDPNPFVVGEAGYQKFLDVMGECMQAQIDRRSE